MRLADDDRARLRLGLLGEQAQRGELVLDVLERDQHLLAVARHRAVELRRWCSRCRPCAARRRAAAARTARRSARRATTTGTDRRGRSRRSRRKPVSATLGNHAALATPTRDCAASIVSAPPRRPGRRVSTVLGTPAGIGGQRGAPLRVLQRELRWALAHQHGERVLELGAAAVERQRLRFGRGHLGARARHVELGDVARAPAPLGQASVSR